MKIVKLIWEDNSASDYPNLQNDLEIATETALGLVRGTIQAMFEKGDNTDKVKALHERFFGTWEQNRWSTVYEAFKDIRSELSTGQMSYNVSKAKLSDTGSYGATWEDSADRNIDIFGAFLTAPLLGKDAKFGVIIHETSHNVVDHISDQNKTYYLEQVLALAKNDPEKATHCAQNYEYFVEYGQSEGIIHSLDKDVG